MVCGLFGLRLCRFRTTFTLSQNEDFKTDIQEIGGHSPNESYRPFSQERYNTENGLQTSTVNRIDPSMVQLPLHREKKIHDADNQRIATSDASNSVNVKDPTSATPENSNKHIKDAKKKEKKKNSKQEVPVALATASIEVEDLNNDISASSPTGSYPAYSPPPYYETMSIETKDSRSSTNTPVYSTFKPDENENGSEITSTNLPSSWDLINEHRRNIRRLPNNNPNIGNQLEDNKDRQRLYSLPKEDSVSIRNKHYA